MVTVKAPGGAMFELTVRIEVAEPLAARTRLVALSDTVGPDGKTEALRVTFPAKPL
jgi:hypothetical protein